MREVELETPLAEDEVRALEVGDRVLLTGRVVTARDRAHQYLAREATPDDLPFDLSGGAIYHCGPIVKTREDSSYEVVAAGPTTSARMNMYVPQILRKFGVRAIIGKGGMDAEVLAALEACRAVYLSAVGGAAQVLAAAVEQIEGCFKVDEFGGPEGMWIFRVRDFPTVLTMDAHGHSLHEKLERASKRQLGSLLDIQ